MLELWDYLVQFLVTAYGFCAALREYYRARRRPWPEGCGRRGDCSGGAVGTWAGQPRILAFCAWNSDSEITPCALRSASLASSSALPADAVSRT